MDNKQFWHVREKALFHIFRVCPRINVQDCSNLVPNPSTKCLLLSLSVPRINVQDSRYRLLLQGGFLSKP